MHRSVLKNDYLEIEYLTSSLGSSVCYLPANPTCWQTSAIPTPFGNFHVRREHRLLARILVDSVGFEKTQAVHFAKPLQASRSCDFIW